MSQCVLVKFGALKSVYSFKRNYHDFFASRLRKCGWCLNQASRPDTTADCDPKDGQEKEQVEVEKERETTVTGKLNTSLQTEPRLQPTV